MLTTLILELDELADAPEACKRVRIDIKLGGAWIEGTTDKKGDVVECWTYKVVNFKPELLKRRFFETYHWKTADGAYLELYFYKSSQRLDF